MVVLVVVLVVLVVVVLVVALVVVVAGIHASATDEARRMERARRSESVCVRARVSERASERKRFNRVHSITRGAGRKPWALARRAQSMA